MAEREIVLLSGMHRSGTSALARVFNLLGAVLPEPLVPPSLGNELGHWEPAEAVALNDAALLAAGGDVNSLHPLSSTWVQDGAAEAFTEELRAWLERVAPAGRLTVVKDPRISLLAPCWRAAVERLGVRPRFVVSWRDPWEVARSLSSRQLEHFPDEVWPHARVELLWLKHQLELERASRGALRSFVAYASLLEDWRATLTRVFEELELPASGISTHDSAAVDAFLRPDKRRQRRPASLDAPVGVTADVLRLLEARVGSPEGGAQAFDRAASRLDDAVTLLGGYVGALEARVSADAATGGDASDARTLVAALREAVRSAEIRAVEAVRRTPHAHAPSADGGDEALADLRGRHDGLLAAHRQLTDELHHARRNLRDERRSERSHDEQTLGAEASDVRTSDLSAMVLDLQASREAQASELDACAQRASREKDLRRSAEGRLRAEAARAAQAEGEAQAAQAASVRLQADVDRMLVESTDHRAAYEALRQEAAAGRMTLAVSRREHEDDVNRRVAAHDLAVTEAARLRGERDIARGEGERLRVEAGALRAEAAILRADAEGLRADAEALRASASWRVTRPVRSVAFRLRRLVRP